MEAYSEPCQTSKMGCFAKIVDGSKPLTIFAKRSILIVWQGPEHASDIGMKQLDNTNENIFSYMHDTPQYLAINLLVNNT